MSLPIYQRVAVNASGDVIPGAEYSVVNEATGLAFAIYSDRGGATLKSAPYFADANGVIQFFIAAGTTFRVVATGGVGTYTDRYVYAAYAQESATDTTAGRLMRVGAGGLLNASAQISHPSNWDTQGLTSQIAKSSGGVQTGSSPYSNPFGITFVGAYDPDGEPELQAKLHIRHGIAPKAHIQGQADGDWAELYHTGNLNTDRFGGVANGVVLPAGVGRDANEVLFTAPLIMLSKPTTCTVGLGTFTIRDSGFTVVVGGIVAADITFFPSDSSGKTALIGVTKTATFTAEDSYYLIGDATTSTLEFS